MHDILIGIPTLNNPELLNNCLDSIFKTYDIRKYNVKVLALDDYSSSENLKKNKEICASYKIDLLMNTKRLGVAQSWNTIIKHCDSEFIILLNDDVAVVHNWLDVVIYTLKNNEKIGVVGLNAYEGYNSYLLPNNIPTYVEAKIMLGGNIHPILSSRGYAFAFRRNDYNKIGGFDNSYFCFFEEVDFNLSMMTVLSKRNCILSYPIIKHAHGSTTFKELSNHTDTFEKSKFIFEKKWKISWERIRELFHYKKIPEINFALNEWNSNYNIWG
jgi:GT2 family glycosyltransferase